MCRFIWSGKKDGRKISFVKWSNICISKDHGGLGLKNLKAMNSVLVMKIGWGLLSNPNRFWVKVLCTKYNIDPDNLPPELSTKYGSHLWKAVGEFRVKFFGGSVGLLEMVR